MAPEAEAYESEVEVSSSTHTYERGFPRHNNLTITTSIPEPPMEEGASMG